MKVVGFERNRKRSIRSFEVSEWVLNFKRREIEVRPGGERWISDPGDRGRHESRRICFSFAPNRTWDYRSWPSPGRDGELLWHWRDVALPNYTERIATRPPRTRRSNCSGIGCPRSKRPADSRPICCNPWWPRSAGRRNCIRTRRNLDGWLKKVVSQS